MRDLAGRVAIITGAGRGLGREHALLFAREGARVVVNDPGRAADGAGEDFAAAQAVVAEIREAGGEAVASTASVSDFAGAKSLVDQAIENYGDLHILVNNAGILRDRTIVNMTEQDWDSVIDVHLKGHFAPLHWAAQYWRARTKEGRDVNAAVVNTSSGSGLRGNPGQLNYAAAKAGIAAMTLVAARELDRYGVRVNAIAPVARTRMTMATPGLAERLAEPDDSGEFDEWDPANVSPLVAWLAGPACTVSGRVFTVRGGHIEWHDGWSIRESYDKEGRWTVPELDTALKAIPAGPPALDRNW